MKTLPIAIAAILSASASVPIYAASSCDELLASEYTCTLTLEGGSPFTHYMYVYSPSGPWDFDADFAGTSHQCICQAKGSTKRPKFRESTDFLCNDAGNYAEAMVGKVSKKGIKKGQYQWTGGSLAGVFECDAGISPVAPEGALPDREE
jgi:hypothetical protein